MNLNSRTEPLRTTGMSQPPILGLNGPSFIQNPSQLGPQGAMGLPPNSSGGHSTMGMLSGSVSNSNPNMLGGQRYPMQPSMMSQNARLAMRPGQPPMNGPGGSMQAPHMSNHQLSNLNLPGAMIPPGTGNAQMRRSVSQPQTGMGHVGGLPPGVNGNNMGMGIGQSASVPPQMRQPQPGQHPIRQIQHMTPDMAMVMGGRPGASGNMGPNVPRVPIMNSLGQPPNMNQPGMSGGMPPHQNFPNNIGMSHQPPQLSSSPRPGSHGQTHNPTMSIGASGPSQPPINRRMTPDNSNNFMGLPPFPPGPGGGNRMNSYPMISTPPMNDMQQSIPGSLGNTQNSAPNRPDFNPTPAQQYQSMQPSSGDNNFPFGIPPPHSNLPSHPPQQPPSHHQSPHLMNIYPTRPQSQPQNQPNQAGRPSSSAGSSQTPRPSQQQPPHPPNVNVPQPGRLPQTGPSNNMRPPSSTGVSQPPPIAPRPPNQPQPPNSEPSPPASSSPPSDQPQQSQPQQQPVASTSNAVVPRTVPSTMNTPALGHGVGLIRLLQFSGILANESKQKLQLSWWNELIREYFTPKAIMRFTLWKDNQRNEAKPFEIGVPILPRFFLVTTQSGVKSMTLTLDGARERLYSYGHAIVECVSAVWTYKYNNGYTVSLRGPLTVHVVLTAPPPLGTAAPQTAGNYLLKFEDFQFDAVMHDKYIALESIMGPRSMESPRTPRSRNPPVNGSDEMQQDLEEEKKWEEPRVVIERGVIPGEPVNAFGIPQATMRCLELAESVAQMSDLIVFSYENGLGPKESLNKMAHKILSFPLPPSLPQQSSMVNGNNLGGLPQHSPFASMPNGLPTNSTSTISLYTSAPPSVTNPSSSQTQGQTPSTMTSTMSSPQNAPPSANSSPRKGHKTIPGQQPPAGAASATSTNPGSVPASGSTPGSSSNTNTPAMGNSSLKRKVSESPAQASVEAQPPSKRTTRKRGKTNGG